MGHLYFKIPKGADATNDYVCGSVYVGNFYFGILYVDVDAY